MLLKKNFRIQNFIRNILVVFICLVLNNCTPGMSLYLKNITNDDIFLTYSLCDDLLNENIEKTFEGIITKNESVKILFSWNNFYNRGVAKEDYKNKETFLTIFEYMRIEEINSNKIKTKEDLEKYDLEYIKKGVSEHIFILKIL